MVSHLNGHICLGPAWIHIDKQIIEKAKPGKQWNASGPLALLQLSIEKAHAQIIQD